MKRIVILESQLMLLTEASLEDIYSKYYSDIPWGLFSQIINLDPTASNGRMGKYGKWLLNIYKKGTFKEGDFGEAKDLLPIYDKYRNVISVKDIMKLNSMGELYNVVEPYIGGNEATSKSDAARKVKEGAEKVYEDDKWVIIVPHTMEAAQLYGKNTKWCTASKDKEKNMFKRYNDIGPLFINIRKADGRKFQFHFKVYPGQFMDELDEPILKNDYDHSMAEVMGLTPGAVEFYKSKYPKFKDICLLIYGYNKTVEVAGKYIKNGDKKTYQLFGGFTDDENSKYYIVNVAGKSNYVDKHSFKPLSKEWYTNCSKFKNGYGIVQKKVFENKNSSYTYIDENGKLCGKWFNTCSPIDENGFGIVGIWVEREGDKRYGNVEMHCNIIEAGTWKYLFPGYFTSIQGGKLRENEYFFAEIGDDKMVFLTLSGNYITEDELKRKYIEFIESNDDILRAVYDYESNNRDKQPNDYYEKVGGDKIAFDAFTKEYLGEEPCWQMLEATSNAYYEWLKNKGF